VADVTNQTIPVASLGDYQAGGDRQRRFVATVGAALDDIGFFALADHGVDLQVIERSYAIAASFFLQPEAEKRRFEVPGILGQRGYTAFGVEHARDSGAPDLKEFWHVGQELPPTHPLAQTYPANVWPEVQGFKATFLELFRQLEACALQLLEACALHIGEARDRFAGAARAGNHVLRVIHYPPVAADRHPQSIRAAAHEDINFITLLCEATAGGLELLDRGGRWRPVSAPKGQIIVDSGDMLQSLTNGYFKSTTHRVVNPGNSRERRYSIPFFVHPRAETDLTPLPSCVKLTGGELKYPKTTAGAFLEQRLREIGMGK
jgi:isopenicillin N synthase-like dioxygenase